MKERKSILDVRQYPHGKPRIKPPPEFFQAYEFLREANYGDHWLRDEALEKIKAYAKQQQHYKENSPRDEIYYLWALCLQAEILDYYEKHSEMKDVLAIEGARLRVDLREGIIGARHRGPTFKPLVRQQLWVLVLYAHNKYRLCEPEEAREVLEDVREELDVHFPLDDSRNPGEPSYGLRARIAYSLGQVLRHLSDLSARKEFMKAIYFTRQRLRAKREKYGQCPEREQKYANYIVAKSFSFGLAWASFHGGELQRALGASSAGSALLESTNDPVHRAYAHVMYAQILSAIAQPVRNGMSISADLQEAIDILEPVAQWGQRSSREESPLLIVPKLLARARYVLATAYFMAGLLQEAEELAVTVYNSKSPGRWRVECTALLVRILLSKGHIVEANKRSDELLELVKPKNVTDAQRAEAFLCKVEVLLAKNGKQKDLKANQMIQEILEKASKLSSENPFLTALCIVQRGRYYVRIKSRDEAQAEFSAWEKMAGKIENGYIKQAGQDLRSEIGGMDLRLVIEPDIFRIKGDKQKVNDLVLYWMFQVIYSRYPSKFMKKAHDLLDISSYNTLMGYMKRCGFAMPKEKVTTETKETNSPGRHKFKKMR